MVSMTTKTMARAPMMAIAMKMMSRSRRMMAMGTRHDVFLLTTAVQGHAEHFANSSQVECAALQEYESQGYTARI